MSPEDARSLVAMIRGVEERNVEWNDPDILLLTGSDTDEERICELIASIMVFMEVPQENTWLKNKMGNVIDLIKNQNNMEISALLGDLSDWLVKWDNEDGSAEVNGKTIWKNLIKIPTSLWNIRMDFIKDYEVMKGLGKLELKNNYLVSAFEYSKKLGKVFDYVHDVGKNMSGSDSSTGITCSRVLGWAENVYKALNIFDSFQKAKKTPLTHM